MIVREAYRDVQVRVCRDHYSGCKALPSDAPSLGPVSDARDDEGCDYCGTSADHHRGGVPKRIELRAGQVWRIGPRYVGNGEFAHDNGTGVVVRLMRKMSDGADWYVTRDVDGGDGADWDWMMHESRLERGELLRDVPIQSPDDPHPPS